MKKNNIQFSHTNYEIINNKGILIGKMPVKKISYENLIKSCDIGLSTVVLKRKILPKILFHHLSQRKTMSSMVKTFKKK